MYTLYQAQHGPSFILPLESEFSRFQGRGGASKKRDYPQPTHSLSPILQAFRPIASPQPCLRLGRLSGSARGVVGLSFRYHGVSLAFICTHLPPPRPGHGIEKNRVRRQEMKMKRCWGPLRRHRIQARSYKARKGDSVPLCVTWQAKGRESVVSVYAKYLSLCSVVVGCGMAASGAAAAVAPIGAGRRELGHTPTAPPRYV